MIEKASTLVVPLIDRVASAAPKLFDEVFSLSRLELPSLLKSINVKVLEQETGQLKGVGRFHTNVRTLSGEQFDVIARQPTTLNGQITADALSDFEQRMRLETSAYNVQSRANWPFSTLFPTTVQINATAYAQEKVGDSLGRVAMSYDRNTQAFSPVKLNEYLSNSAWFRSKIQSDARFVDQLEQALVERQILGEVEDGHAGNLVFETRAGIPRFGNIDLVRWADDSIAHPLKPNPPLIDYFAGRGLSASTVDRLEKFVKQYSPSDSISDFLKAGFTRDEAASMIERANWFATNKLFPS